jgi:hemerythrin superfamily protein
MRVTELLAQDHRTVHEMFLELEGLPARDVAGRRALLNRIVDELEVHAQAEEATFYPAVRATSRRIDDAEAGHAHLRAVIAEVQRCDPGGDDFPDAVRLVKRIVLGHVLEEESGIFLDAERMGAAELERLGAAFQQHKQALTEGGRRAAAKKIA